MAAGDTSEVVLDSVSTYGPQMALIGAAGVLAGAALWGVKRGWAFFKSLARP